MLKPREILTLLYHKPNQAVKLPLKRVIYLQPCTEACIFEPSEVKKSTLLTLYSIQRNQLLQLHSFSFTIQTNALL
jgi:hypothetical protein